ncbi:hypothetical protein HMPREF0262_01828 [Clostridium sp. ATCC 29733]|nr:hypothetical protein HMPREF0262_01828 [Clostridium sp. ATCC 29733]
MSHQKRAINQPFSCCKKGGPLGKKRRYPLFPHIAVKPFSL